MANPLSILPLAHSFPEADRQELERALRKLRREGYRSQCHRGGRPCKRDTLNQARNLKGLVIRPEGDGWVAELAFRRWHGHSGLFRRLPCHGSYPSRAQALAEARNELRRMMFAPEKKRR